MRSIAIAGLGRPFIVGLGGTSGVLSSSWARTKYLGTKGHIDPIAACTFIRHEGGMFGELLEEGKAECGSNGDIEALDRPTLCIGNMARGQSRNSRGSMKKRPHRGAGLETVRGPGCLTHA